MQEWFSSNAAAFPFENRLPFDALRSTRVHQLSSVKPVPMATAPLSLHRIVARESFYGVQRTDAVQVADEHGTWYGRVQLLFRFFSADRTCLNFAVVHQYESELYSREQRNSISDFYLVPSRNDWKYQVVNAKAIDHRVVFIRDFRCVDRYFVHK